MVGADRKIKEAMAAGVTFSQKDMLLKSSDHNRPLYCKGKIDTLTVNRVLIDPGSAVNILPAKIFKKLSHRRHELEESSIVVQGFDKHPQTPLGGINLKVTFGDLQTDAYFLVIDADTSYKALL